MRATVTGEAAVVAVDGEIDLASVGAMDRAVDEAVATGAPLIVVDAQHVTFMGVCAVPILARANTAVQARDGRLIVRAAPSSVVRLLTLAGLAEVLEPSPTPS